MSGAGLWLTLDKAGFHAVWLLVSTLWQSSILLLAAGAVAYFLRRRRAAIRHAVWAAALLSLPLIPILGWAASRAQAPQAAIPVVPAYTAPQVAALPQEAPPAFPAIVSPRSHGPVEYVPPSEPVAAAQHPAAKTPDPAPTAVRQKPATPEKPFALSDYPWAIGFVSYGMGALTFLSLVIIGRIRIGRWASRGQAITDPRALDAFHTAATRLGLTRRFTLIESPSAPSPMAISAFHPVVIMPRQLAQNLSQQDLQAVALHELSHIKRRDALLLTLLSFVRAAFFFHPLVWLACRQASALAESACDDAVLDNTGEPVSYAKMLARLAEDLPRHALGTELAAGIVLSKGAFLRRIEAILSDRKDRIRKLSRMALATTVLAAVLSVALALSLPLGEKKAGESNTQPGSQLATAPATRPTTKRAGYHAYWLTNKDLSGYVDLLIAQAPILQRPAEKFDATKALQDANAIIVRTYAKDFIWNVDRSPFKSVESIGDVDFDNQSVVINGMRYRYAAAPLREVIALLENPEGYIAIHRLNAPLAGGENSAKELLEALEAQAEQSEPLAPYMGPAAQPTPAQALGDVREFADELLKLSPENWQKIELLRIERAEAHSKFPVGLGVHLSLTMKTDPRHSNFVDVMFMIGPFEAPKVPKEQAGALDQIATWRGLTVFVSGSGDDWPNWVRDVKSALGGAGSDLEKKDPYRDLYLRYQALILKAVQAGDADEVARLTTKFSETPRAKLLSVRVTRQPKAGERDKWEVLLDKQFSGGKRKLPAIKYQTAGRPFVSFEDGYVLILPDNLGNGRYPHDVYITMTVDPITPATGPTTAPATGPAATQQGEISANRQREATLIKAVNADPIDYEGVRLALTDVGNVEVHFSRGPLDKEPDRETLLPGVGVQYADGKRYLDFTDGFNRTTRGPVPQEWLTSLAQARKDGYILTAATLAIAPTEEVRKERDRLLAEADSKIRKDLAGLSKDFPRLNATPHDTLAQQLQGSSTKGYLKIEVQLVEASEERTKTGPGICVWLGPLSFYGRGQARPQSQQFESPFVPLENLALGGTVQSYTQDPKLDAAVKKLVDDALAPLKELNKKAAIANAAATASATRPDMSDLATKLTARIPSGWKLTGHGRCDAPTQWSADPTMAKSAGEYLSFRHATAQAIFPPGPASFSLWIMPADYVGRLYETNVEQAGGAALSWVGKEQLLFIQGGATQQHEDWAPVDELIKSLGFEKAPAADITPAASKVAKRLTVLAVEDKDKALPGAGLSTAAAVGSQLPGKFACAAVAKATNDPLVIPHRSGTAYVSQWFQFTQGLAGDADTREHVTYPLSYTIQTKTERPILKDEQTILIVRINNSERFVLQALPDTPENRKLVGMPATAPATAPAAQASKVAWGKAVNGYQCGLFSPARNEVGLAVRNDSQKELAFRDFLIVDRDRISCSQYVEMDLLDADGKAVKSLCDFAKIDPLRQTLKPGQAYQYIFDIRKAFDITKGTYRLKVQVKPDWVEREEWVRSADLEFQADPDGPAVKSREGPQGDAPATGPASAWLEEARKAIPKGWSLKPVASLPGVGRLSPGEAWTVTRDEPIRVMYSSPVGMMPEEQTFQIVFIAGPKVSSDEYRRMVEFNKALEQKFRGNEATLRLMGQLLWWDKRTDGTANRPYLLPTHVDNEHSLSIACAQLASGYYEFKAKEDKAQAANVLADIAARFQSHVAAATRPASAPATAPATRAADSAAIVAGTLEQIHKRVAALAAQHSALAGVADARPRLRDNPKVAQWEFTNNAAEAPRHGKIPPWSAVDAAKPFCRIILYMYPHVDSRPGESQPHLDDQGPVKPGEMLLETEHCQASGEKWDGALMMWSDDVKLIEDVRAIAKEEFASAAPRPATTSMPATRPAPAQPASQPVTMPAFTMVDAEAGKLASIPDDLVEKADYVFIGKVLKVDWARKQPAQATMKEFDFGDWGIAQVKCSLSVRGVQVGQTVHVLVFPRHAYISLADIGETDLWGNVDLKPGSEWLIFATKNAKDASPNLPDQAGKAARVIGAARIVTGKEPIIDEAKKVVAIHALSDDKKFAALKDALASDPLDNLVAGYAGVHIRSTGAAPSEIALAINTAIKRSAKTDWPCRFFLLEVGELWRQFLDGKKNPQLAATLQAMLLEDAPAFADATGDKLDDYVLTLLYVFHDDDKFPYKLPATLPPLAVADSHAIVQALAKIAREMEQAEARLAELQKGADDVRKRDLQRQIEYHVQLRTGLLGLAAALDPAPATHPTTAPTSQGTDDKAMLDLAARVRASHPAGDLAMWEALAELIHPGMTVHQMKLVLPPMLSRGAHGGDTSPLVYPVIVLWNGQRFYIEYCLDGSTKLTAGGVGRAAAEQKPSATAPAAALPDVADKDMVLTNRPTITTVQPAGVPATQPATTGGTVEQNAAASSPDGQFRLTLEGSRLRLDAAGPETKVFLGGGKVSVTADYVGGPRRTFDEVWVNFPFMGYLEPRGLTRDGLNRMVVRAGVFVPSEWKQFELAGLQKDAAGPTVLGPYAMRTHGGAEYFYLTVGNESEFKDQYEKWTARTGADTFPWNYVFDNAQVHDASGERLQLSMINGQGGGSAAMFFVPDKTKPKKVRISDHIGQDLGETEMYLTPKTIKYPVSIKIGMPTAGKTSAVDFTFDKVGPTTRPAAKTTTHPATGPATLSIGSTNAIDGIVGLIGSHDWETRKNAIELAGKLVRSRPAGADMSEFAPLIAPLFAQANWGGLGRDDGEAAADTLVRIGSPVVPTLVAKLKSGDSHDRWSAMDILSRIGEPKKLVLSSARSLLKDRDYYVRWKAIEALGKLGKDAKDAVGDLEADIKDEFEPNQVRVQLALIHIEGISDKRLKAIAGHLKSQDKNLAARFAAEMLADLGTPAQIVLPELLEAMNSSSVNTRLGTTFAIGMIHATDEKAIDALIDRLKNDPDMEVKRTAAAALGEIGPPAAAAIPALREAFSKYGSDTGWWVAKHAIDSISTRPVTAPATSPAATSAGNEPTPAMDVQQVKAKIAALAVQDDSLSDDEKPNNWLEYRRAWIVPELIEGLSNKNIRVASACMNLLRDTKSPQLLEALLAIAGDESNPLRWPSQQDYRRGALLDLVRFADDERARKLMLPAARYELHIPDPLDRAKLAAAGGDKQLAIAILALVVEKKMATSAPNEATEAVNWLGGLGADAMPLLTKASQSANWDVVTQAFLAMAKADPKGHSLTADQQTFLTHLRGGKETTDNRIKRMEKLAALNRQEIRPFIMQMLSSDQPQIALWIVARWQDREALPQVKRLLQTQPDRSSPWWFREALSAYLAIDATKQADDFILAFAHKEPSNSFELDDAAGAVAAAQIPDARKISLLSDIQNAMESGTSGYRVAVPRSLWRCQADSLPAVLAGLMGKETDLFVLGEYADVASRAVALERRAAVAIQVKRAVELLAASEKDWLAKNPGNSGALDRIAKSILAAAATYNIKGLDHPIGQLLKSPMLEVRTEAATTARKLGVKDGVAASDLELLYQQLASDDVNAREKAADQLTKLPPPNETDRDSREAMILSLLGTPAEDYAMRLLAACGRDRTVAKLTAFLDGEDVSRAIYAAWVLAQLPDKPAADKAIRRLAIWGLFHHQVYQAGEGIDFHIAPGLSFHQVTGRLNPGTYNDDATGPRIPKECVQPFTLDKPEQVFSTRAANSRDGAYLRDMFAQLSQQKDVSWLPMLRSMTATDRVLKPLIVKDQTVADFPLRRQAAKTVAAITGQNATYIGLAGETFDSEQTPSQPYPDQEKLVAKSVADQIAHFLTMPMTIPMEHGTAFRERDAWTQTMVERAARDLGKDLPAMIEAELTRRGIDKLLHRLPDVRYSGGEQNFRSDSVFAAVCEAVDRPSATKQLSAELFETTQEFKIIEVLRGQAPSAKTITLHYSWERFQWGGEREITKGETVIWRTIAQFEPGRGPGLDPKAWFGRQALPDTPAQRKLLGPSAAQPPSNPTTQPR